MTLISLTDCCHLLAIDPKTLRRWMSLSHLEARKTPLDARRKCLTHEQLQQLAAAHRRTLEGLCLQPETSALPTPRVSATVLSNGRPNSGVIPLSITIQILGFLFKRLMGLCLIRKRVISPDFSAPLTSLTKQLASLQAHVATLQHQLTLLTDQWQKEQQQRASQVSMLLDKSGEPSQHKSLRSSPDKSGEPSRQKSGEPSQDRSLRSSPDKSREPSQDESRQKESAHTSANTASIDRRKRPHVLPLVEYGAQGKYVVISPERGLLELVPDSPEWFAWLSRLSSFRFVGQYGRFTAHRRGSTSPNKSWRATRSIRNRSYNHPLGKTASLTVAALEQVAAALQSHLN